MERVASFEVYLFGSRDENVNLKHLLVSGEGNGSRSGNCELRKLQLHEGLLPWNGKLRRPVNVKKELRRTNEEGAHLT